jgi:hypothetical protein
MGIPPPMQNDELRHPHPSEMVVTGVPATSMQNVEVVHPHLSQEGGGQIPSLIEGGCGHPHPS